MTSFSASDVTVLSVCYKSDAVVGEMLRSVPCETPVILIDNGITNRFDAVSPSGKVSIVELAKNEGFGRGCNAGASEAKTTWLLFLNPDARLEKGAIEALLRAAEQYPEASAFNPRISTSDGGTYFKRRSYLLPRKEYMKRGWPESDCQVPVLSGAAIFISKEKFDAVEGFDPKIFLYHEDDDLSLRLRKLGPLMFIRDAVVSHASGHSSGRSSDVAYLKAYHMARSRIYAGRKHKRPMPMFFALLDAAIQWLAPMTLFSQRRRAKAKGYVIGLLASKFSSGT
jgi:N-acetylglucosaminyl-diphospho-decaprenol L-rhamnosyltransferase